MDHYSFGAVLAANLVDTFDVAGDEELLGLFVARPWGHGHTDELKVFVADVVPLRMPARR